MSLFSFDMSLEKIKQRMESSHSMNVIDLGGDFNGGLVRVGECVVFNNPHPVSVSSSRISVAQVISIEDRRDVEHSELNLPARKLRSHASNEDGKERLVLMRYLEVVDSDKEVPPPCPRKYPFVHGTLQEVIITRKLQWIPSERTLNLAFIFQIDAIQDGTYPITAGVRNVYFCRSFVDNGDVLRPLNRQSFDPFYNPYGSESYSKRVHNSLAVLNEFTARAMSGKKGQWDGRSKHVHLPGFHRESFEYIRGMIKQPQAKRKLDFCDGSYSYQKAKKCYNPDLSVCNRRKKVRVSMLRILDEEELDSVREVLGSTFAVGLTKSAPSFKAMKESEKTPNKLSPTVKLNDHDQVRIVTCSNEDYDYNSRKDQSPAITVSTTGDIGAVTAYDKTFPQPRLLPFPGLDFQLEETSCLTNLKVSARFKKLLGSSDTVRKAQNAGHLPVSEGAIGDETLVLECDDEFRYHGIVYCVKAIRDDGTIRCRLSSDDSSSDIVLDRATVQSLVHDFNHPS